MKIIYRCMKCGHIYDPAENNGVEFEDLPAGWRCPVCGVGKDEFEPVHEGGEYVPEIQNSNNQISVKLASAATRVEIYNANWEMIKGQTLMQDEREVFFSGLAHSDNLRALAFSKEHGALLSS